MKPFPLLLLLAQSTLMALSGAPSQATDLIVEDKAPNLGIGVYDRNDIRWRSQAIVHPDKVTDANRIWSGPDVFESEFGEPLDFSHDLIAQHGYSSGARYMVGNGQLVVTTGVDGFAFGFGGIPGDKNWPAIFPAATWGKNRKDMVRLQMVLEQNVAESKWRLSTATPDSYKVQKEFTVSGTGRQTWEADVTFARSINDVWSQDTGLKLECLTPNVALKLDSIKLAPSSANIYFRKSFKLAQKPVLAHASFNDFDTFDLYVNGRLVTQGNHLYTSGTLRRVNLAPFLRVGTNTIAYRKEFYTWAGDSSEPLLFEGVSVSRSGQVTRILSDETWRTSYSAPTAWMVPGFDDSGWKQARSLGATGNAPHLTSLWDKNSTVVPNGLDPGHMGALDVAPNNRQYPLFEDNETPAFRVRLPAGMQGKFKVTAAIYKAGTSTLVERTAAGAFRVSGNFTQAIVPLKTRVVGPYRVEWTLRDLAGKTLESRPEELVIIGPIPQQKVGLASFEKEFEKRLQRVLSIDCTQPTTTGDEFLDHTGWSQAQLNTGRVTTANGMTYRETGPGIFDYFSYRLHGLTRGVPYLVEVMVPDNEERAIYASVMESHPVNYFNNGYFAGWHTATGAARTGGRYPITNRLRPVRFVYFPGSPSSAITIINTINGVRAAAKEINVYRINGGLPALSMPTSSRLIGPHDERITLNAKTFGGENVLENAIPTALNGHRDGWYHWYRIYERKISYLRFQGFNMSIEGLYQYYDTSFPKNRSSWTSDGSQDEIDLPLLAIKMYKRNGIKVFLGVEYSYDPQLSIDPSETISDRRMWAGEKTFQAVDRYGRQVGRGIWGNGNFLHPTTQKYFGKLIQEIYHRYQSAGPVEGMYLGTFGWLLPGFQPGTDWNAPPLDIGYDDTTAALFEQQTGIALNIDAHDPQRFQKRYAILTGKYLAQWKRWRAQKVRQSYDEISRTVRAQNAKWKLLLEPTLQTESQSPFRSLESTSSQRATSFADLSSDIDMPVGMYSDLPGITVASPLPASAWQAHSPGDNVLSAQGLLSQPQTGQAIEKIGGMALGGPLDEINMPSTAAPRWIWTQGTAGIFIPRPIEDNAMNDFVNVLRHGIPQTIIYSWLDVNAETAFGPQLRRFNKSFAVTPSNVTFKEVPADRARGIVAQTALRPGSSYSYVRLINNSPYTLSGTMTVSTGVRDLVYDVALKPIVNRTDDYSLQLKPNDIRILALTPSTTSRFSLSVMRFSFDFDAATTATVMAQARSLLDNANLSASIPADKRAALQQAVASGDGFGTYSILDTWEVLAVTSNAKLFATGPDNQQRLLAMLQNEGAARIDVGAGEEYRDAEGHLWLSDQAFLGTRFYGYNRGNPGVRGDIPIADTKSPRVYQTELWGDGMSYRVPVPNGRYNLSLHFAETYAPYNQPGSRIFGVGVQGAAPESIDLIARAGGQYRPFILSRPVTVSNGLIEVKFSGNAELNGIVIEKAASLAPSTSARQ